MFVARCPKGMAGWVVKWRVRTAHLTRAPLLEPDDEAGDREHGDHEAGDADEDAAGQTEGAARVQRKLPGKKSVAGGLGGAAADMAYRAVAGVDIHLSHPIVGDVILALEVDAVEPVCRLVPDTVRCQRRLRLLRGLDGFIKAEPGRG